MVLLSLSLSPLSLYIYYRQDISWDESIATFHGCDASLLGGARTVMVVTYVIGGGTVLLLCCACGLTFAYLAEEIERHERHGGEHEMH